MNIPGLDIWLTASPYDDTKCARCFAPLPDDFDDEKEPWLFEGFCCKECENSPVQPTFIKPMDKLLAEQFGQEGLFNIDTACKAIYKGTDCGASIRAAGADKIFIGSIVEGSDAEVTRYLTWPFTKEEFWSTVQEVNDEASVLWKEANES